MPACAITKERINSNSMRFIFIAFIVFAILFPTQSNAQWEIEDSHTTASLRGVHNVGGGVAWASGTNGTVLRTEDDGHLWKACAIPPGAEKLDFRGIQAFDNNTAIVMSSGPGDQSRLYKTTDGCQTWRLLFTSPDKDGFWDALSINWPGHDLLGKALGNSHAYGYLLGDLVDGKFVIFSTNDSGETWHRRIAAKRGPQGEGCKVDEFEAWANEAAFAASNQSLLALNGTHLFFVTGGPKSHLRHNDLFSLDGALCHESVHSLKLPLASGGASSGAFAVATTPDYAEHGNWPDKLVIVGGDYKLPDESAGTAVTIRQVAPLYRYSAKAAQTPPHGYRSAVAYDSATKTWITVGPNGTDISTDDGRNWRALTPSSLDEKDADKNWNALSLPFVVGPKGRIGKLQANALPAPGSSKK
jgi:hypothetical protein